MVALGHRLITRFAGNRAKRQPLIQRRQNQPTPQLADHAAELAPPHRTPTPRPHKNRFLRLRPGLRSPTIRHIFRLWTMAERGQNAP
jgi:hypothetical protein